jgi:Protein of unknown function (DUF3105)
MRRSRFWVRFVSACIRKEYTPGGYQPLLPSRAVASRQEEKQRRREERMAQERAQAAAVARRKRLQLALGAVLGLAVIAGVVVLALGVLSKDDKSGGSGKPGTPAASVTLPQQQTSDVNAAAKAAGCVLQHPAIEGRGHETKDFKASDYKTNPPTSGAHFPQWYDDGVYNPGDVPNLGMLVHTLEHGRIDVQYKPGTPASTVKGLEALLAEQDDGYHMLLFQNTTNMPYAVAATAWGQLLGCKTMNDKVYDALRTFRERYIDKGPESQP